MTSTEEHTENHEAFIKTPRQLIVTVILAFVVPIVIIIMLVNLVAVSRSEEHTSELQSLMRISYAVFCLKKKNKQNNSEYENSKPNTSVVSNHINRACQS